MHVDVIYIYYYRISVIILSRWRFREVDAVQAPTHHCAIRDVYRETMHLYAEAVQSYDRAAELMPEDRTVREYRDVCMRKLERSIDLA